jgi:hypothetical protein
MEPEVLLSCSQERTTDYYSGMDEPSPQAHILFLRFILTLVFYSRLGLPSGLFPSGVLVEFCIHFSSPISATCLARLIFHVLILIRSDEEDTS